MRKFLKAAKLGMYQKNFERNAKKLIWIQWQYTQTISYTTTYRTILKKSSAKIKIEKKYEKSPFPFLDTYGQVLLK